MGRAIALGAAAGARWHERRRDSAARSHSGCVREAECGLGDGGTVLVEPVDGVQLRPGEPAQCVVVLQRTRFAGEQSGGPHLEDVSGFERPLAGDALARFDLDAEFLTEFADQGLFGALARFELAAGEFPAAA